MSNKYHHNCRGKNKDGSSCTYIAKFAYEGSAEYCKNHKKSKMINVRKCVCADIVCGKKSSFAFSFDDPDRFCKTHMS